MTEIEAESRYATDFIPGHTDRTVILDNPVLDRLVSTVIEMGAELWMQRRRLLALERTLAQNGIPAATLIEQAVPDETELAEERSRRDAMIDRVYGPLFAAMNDSSPTR